MTTPEQPSTDVLQTIHSADMSVTFHGNLPDCRQYAQIKQLLYEIFLEDNTKETGENSAELIAEFNEDITALSTYGDQTYYHAEGKSSQTLSNFSPEAQERLAQIANNTPSA